MVTLPMSVEDHQRGLFAPNPQLEVVEKIIGWRFQERKDGSFAVTPSLSRLSRVNEGSSSNSPKNTGPCLVFRLKNDPPRATSTARVSSVSSSRHRAWR